MDGDVRGAPVGPGAGSVPSGGTADRAGAPGPSDPGAGPFVLERARFGDLIELLQRRGYRVVGPTVRDGAIVYGEIQEETDLPIGWTDQQDAGRYRLARRSDGALFGYNVGPHSWKKYLFPPRERLWTAERTADGFSIRPDTVPERTAYAFLGVRACEIAAIAVQDQVFGAAHDPSYRARRERTLRVSVQCGQAGRTCFCVSMGTGPGVSGGDDLRLTEVVDPERHFFLVEAASDVGRELLGELPLRAATAPEVSAGRARVETAAHQMGRTLETRGIRDLLVDHPEHPRWSEVARRCLSCANCTLACPTCFCQTTEEVPDLTGDRVERWRRWDSCFNSAFSELHGTPVRSSTTGRYRQWMTHKLATWYDQFGRSGCVGCGRCITWCPVGIDITEEVAAIRSSPTAPAPGASL